jgi:aminoglycoside phosphotransferase family enzyme
LDAADPVEESPLPRALLEPECYDHPTTAIRLVETHISWVLLTGPYAYKIKKPLRLPFLDFASMAARRHFCEEELRVNRRLAPDLYLDVVPITGSPSQPRVAGAGRAFEHAVRMVQFDERERLDLMAERGELEEDRIREAARLVARFHAAAAAAGIDDGFATPARIRTESLENLDALDAATGHDAPTLARLRAWTEHSLEALAEAFSERHATGRVRECHGDLHLANMALWRGAVLAFDAIEFDERLRWIDVMSEVAFTLMDLHHRRREGLAFAFLDEYLQGSGDHAGLAVLRHYLVYRALVRAKIDAIRADATGGDARREAMVEEHSQIALAARFAFEAPPPLMILTPPAPAGAHALRRGGDRAHLRAPGAGGRPRGRRRLAGHRRRDLPRAAGAGAGARGGGAARRARRDTGVRRRPRHPAHPGLVARTGRGRCLGSDVGGTRGPARSVPAAVGARARMHRQRGHWRCDRRPVGRGRAAPASRGTATSRLTLMLINTLDRGGLHPPNVQEMREIGTWPTVGMTGADATRTTIWSA